MNVKVIAIAAVLLLVAGLGGGWYVRSKGADADLASAKLDRAADQTGAALAFGQAEALRLSQYQAQANQLAAADAAHQKDMSDAQARADRVVADLRTGTLRLRDEWATARATAAVQSAAGASQPDAAAELRATGARDLVLAGAQCDSTITALQRALTADRAEASDHR